MSFGTELREAVAERPIMSFIGVYDAFSAALAGRRFDALFLSGFGFAASHYGLPDVGFIAWPDMVAYVERIRTILPGHHLLVDIDDGYCDVEVACHVAALLERAGASGVVLEDQRRPRRCGHLGGKQILDLDTYLEKLTRVLAARRDLFVLARTDASEPDEILRRVDAFQAAGPDAVLVDGIGDLDLVRALAERLSLPLTFNQIAGGKSPPRSLEELRRVGVSLVIYSTPCLFSAQRAIDEALIELAGRDGRLPDPAQGGVGIRECNALLNENLERSRAGGGAAVSRPVAAGGA
jgi:2-methylisocitrate lyase-like PEP mutase family enzyme